MKFYLAAIVSAVLLAAVASGAPSSPKQSFLDHVKIPILDKAKEFFSSIKCMGDVVSDVLEKNDVKGVLKDSKIDLEQLGKIDWKRCNEMKDMHAKQECKVAVAQKAYKILYDVYEKLFDEHHMDLRNKVLDEVADKCFKHHVELSYVSEMKANPTFFEQFKCFVDVLGTVSKSQGLEKMWSKTGPVLENNIKQWSECTKVENKFARIFCNIKEGVASYKTLSEYLKKAAAEKPEFMQALVPEFKKQCGSMKNEKILTSLLSMGSYEFDGLEKLKCISSAITDAVHETSLEEIWVKYQDELADKFERIQDCKKEADKMKFAKCVYWEVFSSYEIFGRFFKDLKEVNHETYSRIHDNVKNRCFS